MIEILFHKIFKRKKTILDN